MFDWLTYDKKHVWHPFTQMKTASEPLEIVKAKDASFYTAKGNKYIDINSSWWVNVHGHAHPHIAEALYKQFSTVDHVIFAEATHHKAIELACRISKKLPEKFQKVFFSDNGSTAVEVALKMVMQYWHNRKISRKTILSIQGAYHGDTFGAMSVGQRGVFNKPFEPYFFDVHFLDFPYKYNETQVLKNAQLQMKTGNVACVIIEPLVQGASGMKMYSGEFLDELIKLCNKFEVKVIFDEVMTAWGRTGKLFALQHIKEKPDIICLSKGLTGGVLPLGLTVTTNEIYEAFLSNELSSALLHGHSFTANALSCACACASLDLFEKKETWDNIQKITNWNETLAKEMKGHIRIKETRQIGTILAFELKENTNKSYFSNQKQEVVEHFLKYGIFIRPLGNVFFFNPPYCINDTELEAVRIATINFGK